MPGGPPKRFCRTPEDFEEAAADYMRWLGYNDATRTPTGPDGGIDVQASKAVGQVKAHMVPIGLPEIQRLKGIAHDGRAALFFSLMDYTPQAVTFAKSANVALFRFAGYDGSIESVNDVSRGLVSRRTDGSARTPHRRPRKPAKPRDAEPLNAEHFKEVRAQQEAAIFKDVRGQKEVAIFAVERDPKLARVVGNRLATRICHVCKEALKVSGTEIDRLHGATVPLDFVCSNSDCGARFYRDARGVLHQV